MKLFSMLLAGSLLFGANIASLQFQRLHIDHPDGKSYVVERYIPAECLDVSISPEQITDKENVPFTCIQPLVMTAGNITKIAIDGSIKTCGELEVLDFLRKMRSNTQTMLIIDSRGHEWYEHETIPGAVNIWYKYLTKPDTFPEEYKATLKLLRIVDNGNGEFDVSDVPELLLFCNGPWCSQSTKAIDVLLKMGYPAEKLRWYRSGIHAWKSLSLTTTAVQAP